MAAGERRGWIRQARRFLRAPGLIVGEVLAIALACAVTSLVPQAPEWTPQGERFAEEHPALAPAAHALGLDDVMHGWWFIALIALAAASLLVVQIDQWRRFSRVWSAEIDEAAFGRAPFRAVLERPRSGEAEARFTSRGRAGLLGTPLFHLGLLLVVLAGAGRALFGREAAAELIEGEPLREWTAQWGGPFSSPLPTPEGARLVSVEEERHGSGGLRRVAVRLASGPRELELDLNTPLVQGASRLSLESDHGLAALLELEWPAGVDRRALLLREGARRGQSQAAARFDTGLEVRLRAFGATVEARALRGGALLYAGPLVPGSRVALAGGQALALRALPRWARLHQSRDLALPLAYAGFLLVVLGALLMFAVVRVDTAVVVRPDGPRERVLVALRPQRFAPLYREDFERLVAEQGARG